MSVPVPRVLLVEDDEGDAVLVRQCLLEAGAAGDDVIWVRTLADGIAALDTDPVCVLLDLGLPDANGLDALQTLVGKAGDVPVVVLTGRHDNSGDDAVAAGAQDYLVKDDITPDLLARALRYAVERRRAQTAELQLRAEQLHSAENSRLERGLLPKPKLRSELISCTTYYEPGRDLAVLGGDFFDVIETADGRIRAVIGDVMGHGPDEAALGVHLRVGWRTLVLSGVPDEQILGNLVGLLKAETGDQRGFVTACDVTIDPDLELTIRVAGHPAPLLCQQGSVAYLDVAIGPPLGVEGTPACHRVACGGWPVTRSHLRPSASLMLYTDGLLDAYRTGRSTSVGVDELVTATQTLVRAGGSPASWIPALVSQAPTRSADDTAVVVLTAGTPRQ